MIARLVLIHLSALCAFMGGSIHYGVKRYGERAERAKWACC